MAVDFEALANSGMSADQLANIFLQEYSADKEVSYPINPFQILTNLGIPFVLRPFKKYEGIYIPAAGEGDFPIVGINLNRPITRQRYTAAHELCHHLKDVRSGFICAINAKSEIEKYAEAFASELLMPTAEFETVDYQKIPEEMYFLDKDIKKLMDECDGLSLSEYIERVIQIHHRMTVIHAFRDGNGRTTRAFANMMLLKRHVSPVFFKNQEKNEYKEALKIADTTDSYELLYERFFKSILNSFAELSDFTM